MPVLRKYGREDWSSIRRILYETEGITFDVSAIGQSIFLTNKEAEEKAEHYGTT